MSFKQKDNRIRHNKVSESYEIRLRVFKALKGKKGIMYLSPESYASILCEGLQVEVTVGEKWLAEMCKTRDPFWEISIGNEEACAAESKISVSLLDEGELSFGSFLFSFDRAKGSTFLNSVCAGELMCQCDTLVFTGQYDSQRQKLSVSLSTVGRKNKY